MTIFYNLITALFISAPPPLPVIPAFQQDDRDWGWFVDIDEKYTPSWHKYISSWKDFK